MTYASTILADSPVAYFRLGEPSGTNANNEVGTLDGTYQNSPTLGVTGALTGDVDTAVAFDFDTAFQYVSVPDDASLDLGDVLSIELWFKKATGADATTRMFVGKGSGAYGLDFSFSSDNKFSLIQDQLAIICTSTTAITDTNWHYVVATKNGATVKLWLDGSDVTGSVSNQTLTNTTTELRIGYAIAGGWQSWDGSLDEVALYSVALSSGQVAAHYAARLGSPAPVWTTPADGVSISTTPVLTFTMPDLAANMHFAMELDTASAFNTGNLRDIRTNVSQTGWEYWNDSAWTAFPSAGVLSSYGGNEARYTVQSALSGGTWYRRVRAGT